MAASDQKSIVANRLSKQYRIGALHGEVMLREALSRAVKRVFQRGVPEEETIWALRDMSFEVGSDEVVGIIGRNGSGKTTLLKLLARITYPTSGSVSVRGRVASLVEVGTGFHNELSGRENVFLNGSILGLKRREIAEHFDDIVAYAGVEKFIDTPIKRYSTGMRLRLGFAVAAHLFPDVLLVDEVLAVGDAEFQKKCLDTLGDVGRRGHTVLFVSHNLEAIESICPRTIWIDQGRLRMDGKSRDVIAAYMRETAVTQHSTIDLSDSDRRAGTGEAHITALEFLDADGRAKDVVHSGDAVVLRLHYDVREPINSPYFGVLIATEFGTVIAHPNSWSAGLEIPRVARGAGSVDLRIEHLNLMPGSYPITLWMNRHSDSVSIDYLDQCAALNVVAPPENVLGRPLERRTGSVFFDSTWSITQKS